MNQSTLASNGCSTIPLKEAINVKGKMVAFDAIEVDNLKLVVKGRYLKIAELREEWDQDVTNPGDLIEALRNNGLRAHVLPCPGRWAAALCGAARWARLPAKRPGTSRKP